MRDVTGLPLYYLDMLWHKPDRTTVTREEFDARLQAILEQDAWIVDGNYIRTLPQRLDHCDTVFFLDIPTDVCLAGVEHRIGAQREDMPWAECEFDEEFRRCIIDFPTQRRPQMIAALDYAAAHRGVCIHTLMSREEMAQALACITQGHIRTQPVAGSHNSANGSSETLMEPRLAGNAACSAKGQQNTDAMEDDGFWRILDGLAATSTIVIDRPRGTSHPRYPDSIYPVDYGYLRDTTSMDGDGIDVWVGTGTCGIDAIICVVDLVKRDSEIKVLIDCTEEEKRLIFGVHNETENMKGVLVRRNPPRS
ncbi:hypothetical protein [Bifidobacterium pseudolongum]|uniref:hypothetical protein n=1 Tax=Bifidobacterium pseudolongum TaxID=1694 RepID=UPI001F5D15C7|nr:hypothetical protein [Bifidobacterium pseudolongum]